MSEWHKVFDCLDRMTPGYDPDSGYDPPSPVALAAARRTASVYDAAGKAVPDDVFTMPDGGVMFAWYSPDGTHTYIDFDPRGECQEMVTYKDGRPAVIRDIPAEVT